MSAEALGMGARKGRESIFGNMLAVTGQDEMSGVAAGAGLNPSKWGADELNSLICVHEKSGRD
jgi:hypothetical protein